MQNPPKIKQGQRINLVQVTGNASISGLCRQGMTSPFILGNDFADQYSISVIRQEGGCNLEFGDSGRRMVVENSVSPPFTDEDGHAFKV